MTITKDDVLKISKLTNLNVSGSEEKLADALTKTLEYIEVLDELDTKNIDPTYQVTGLTNVFQKSEPGAETLSKEQALKNAPDQVNGLFATKKVLDK